MALKNVLIFGILSLFILPFSFATSMRSTQWQCAAEGKTQMNEEYEVVAGFPAATLEGAEKEALMACMAAGLFGCTVIACEETELR